jgi:hypothetical protein
VLSIHCVVGQVVGHRIASSKRVGEGQVRVLAQGARGEVRGAPQGAHLDLGGPNHVVEDE